MTPMKCLSGNHPRIAVTTSFINRNRFKLKSDKELGIDVPNELIKFAKHKV